MKRRNKTYRNCGETKENAGIGRRDQEERGNKNVNIEN
jgi:hypothetical protein